jgi:hypothetical protein
VRCLGNKQGEEKMKKMMLVAAACAMVVAPSAILADTVTSVNVVGYLTVTVEPGKLALLSAPLLSFDGSSISALLGNQLPDGSQVYFWNRSKSPAPGYDIASYQSAPPFVLTPSWGGAHTNVIMAGDGFFVKTPASASTTTITLMGEIPAIGNDSGTNVLTNLDGLNVVSYSFPVDVVFTNTTLAANSNVQQIYTWDQENQTYIIYSRQSAGFPVIPFSGAWPSGSPTISAGRAFWVRTASSLDWSEVAPYLDNL